MKSVCGCDVDDMVNGIGCEFRMVLDVLLFCCLFMCVLSLFCANKRWVCELLCGVHMQ